MVAKVERMIAVLTLSLGDRRVRGGKSSERTASTNSVISGSAQQGFMRQSMVQAYSVNPGDGSNGTVLGSTITD
jgi:hypothetical protein